MLCNLYQRKNRALMVLFTLTCLSWHRSISMYFLIKDRAIEIRGHSIRTSAGGGGGGVWKLRTIADKGGGGGLSSEDVLKAARRVNLFPLNSVIGADAVAVLQTIQGRGHNNTDYD